MCAFVPDFDFVQLQQGVGEIHRYLFASMAEYERARPYLDSENQLHWFVRLFAVSFVGSLASFVCDDAALDYVLHCIGSPDVVADAWCLLVTCFCSGRCCFCTQSTSKATLSKISVSHVGWLHWCRGGVRID